MITVFLLTIIFFIICHYLINYIKFIRTGDPNESNENYWRFSYDFKPTKKDYEPEDRDLLKKRFRNRLVFLLYINVLVIFLLLNNLTSHVLENRKLISKTFNSFPLNKNPSFIFKKAFFYSYLFLLRAIKTNPTGFFSFHQKVRLSQ